MQTNQILTANILDLIFENRNKEYGAYELRKTYEKRIKKAMLITASIVVLFFGSLLARSPKTENRNIVVTKTIDLSNIKEKEPELPKPIKQVVQEPVRTEQFTRIEIKPDNEVKQFPPTQEDIETANIDVIKHEGIDANGISRPSEIDNRGIIEEKNNTESNEPLSFVEIEAKFTGNWQRFLERNLNPEVPVSNNAPAGNYTIEIQFVVDTEGNVSDIRPLTNLGYGMEQEAVRVLKKATKWEPAIQNGRKVKAYRRQRITFQVLGE